MKTATARQDMTGLDAILSHLIPKEGELGGYLVTRSREEYDLLLHAAMDGRPLRGVTLGRSGMKLHRKMIIPPDSILCR